MIDERAVIAPGARIADGTSVGPFSVIGDEVEIGEGCTIGPHVVIEGPTRIGPGNTFHAFSSVGIAPQDKKYAGERTELEIGSGNTVFQYCSISRGTGQDAGITRIGDDNWIMAYVHIAHDCTVGDHTVIANCATLAGHVHVHDFATLGGFTKVHQFCRIGMHSFCGMDTGVTRDVPPYVTVSGHPASPHGINSEGLRRRGFDQEAVSAVKHAYRTVYRRGLRLEEAITQLESFAHGHDAVQPFLEFLKVSTGDGSRGIVR